jgi:hypothetical protein
MSLINEMKSKDDGSKWAVFGPNEPPRSNRVIADSWRGLYGSDLFSSTLPFGPGDHVGNDGFDADDPLIRGVLEGGSIPGTVEKT